MVSLHDSLQAPNLHCISSILVLAILRDTLKGYPLFTCLVSCGQVQPKQHRKHSYLQRTYQRAAHKLTVVVHTKLIGVVSFPLCLCYHHTSFLSETVNSLSCADKLTSKNVFLYLRHTMQESVFWNFRNIHHWQSAPLQYRENSV